jgi:hypothetical protein
VEDYIYGLQTAVNGNGKCNHPEGLTSSNYEISFVNGNGNAKSGDCRSDLINQKCGDVNPTLLQRQQVL